MVPKYPTFVDITPEHKEVVDFYSKKFPEYCTYTFGSLYNWSPKKYPTKLSLLNENLVIDTHAFIDNSHYVSFIGDRDVIKTTHLLLQEYNTISLIPEEIANKLKNKFDVREEHMNDNYVFSTENIFHISGKQYRDKRRQVKKFFKSNQEISFKRIDTYNATVQKQVIEVHKTWEKQKNSVPIEFEATVKYLSNKYISKFDIGFFIRNKMIAFSLNDVSNPFMVMGCFAKANKEYKYLSTFYEYITSFLLHLNDYKYINLEMDSGQENFKNEKLSWHPVKILKSYYLQKS